MLLRKKCPPKQSRKTELISSGTHTPLKCGRSTLARPAWPLPVPCPHPSPPHQRKRGHHLGVAQQVHELETSDGRRCSEGANQKRKGGIYRREAPLRLHSPPSPGGPSAAVPPSMSTNLNRIIKGAHPVGPLTGLPTGGCGKPGTATQPWECVPRESIPWKSKRTALLCTGENYPD